MTATQAPPRTMYRLRSRHQLRDQMTWRRMTIRELAIACGGDKYRSSIGNLSSGARDHVGPKLARRIEEALFPGTAPGSLFDAVVTTAQPDIRISRGGRAA